VIEDMSTLQRGHFSTESSAAVARVAAAPQCGQCLLPMNIMPKQDEHAIVASFDSQKRHCGASDEIAAPQFGQWRVWASMINYAFAGARATTSQIITSSHTFATRKSCYLIRYEGLSGRHRIAFSVSEMLD
jgi:hypothetical protein